MRAYSASDEESLRARDLLKDWAGEGYLTDEQYRGMLPETVCGLRRTNIFLRLVLFLFTLLIVAAASGLFFLVLAQGSTDGAGGLLFILAVVCYAGAEFSVSRFRLYRFGIEEALSVCSVGFLCAGVQVAFFSSSSSVVNQADFLVPVVGGVACLWVWHRFGLPYAPLGTMIFVLWIAPEVSWSALAKHLTVVVFYATGLIAVVALRPRHRFTCLNHEYSIAEALLWLGIYLAINLQLWSTDLFGWGIPIGVVPLPRTVYWATWVLIWCLPPVVLVRGVRLKDRFVIAAGGIAVLLTLVTNKSYLGWPRHAWDPMILGTLLIGVALLLRRWLAAGPGGVRHGFTAQRLSGKDKRWISTGTTALGLGSPTTIPGPQPSGPDVQVGGGSSGGGGASSDF